MRFVRVRSSIRTASGARMSSLLAGVVADHTPSEAAITPILTWEGAPRIVVASLLALAVLGSMAHARSSYADLLFKKKPYWDRHVEDEAFGDEFKRH